MSATSPSPLRLGLPKGRMADNVHQLLSDAGIGVRKSARGYRPTIHLDGVEVKILKPQNIVEMLHRGSRDLGFAGYDWVVEKELDLVEILDLGLDPVRIVAAAPQDMLTDGALPAGAYVVASEYQRLTTKWIAAKGLDATFVRSYGATEVFPPEDADFIVDNTATGSTLRANGLQIFDTLLRSSTRMFANPAAMDEPAKRDRIEQIAMVLKSVLEARARVMVEVNCGPDDLDRIIEILPCMRQPTVNTLHGGAGFAVKSAVPKVDIAELVPRLKSHGGTDVVVTALAQIVP